MLLNVNNIFFSCHSELRKVVCKVNWWETCQFVDYFKLAKLLTFHRNCENIFFEVILFTYFNIVMFIYLGSLWTRARSWRRWRIQPLKIKQRLWRFFERLEDDTVYHFRISYLLKSRFIWRNRTTTMVLSSPYHRWYPTHSLNDKYNLSPLYSNFVIKNILNKYYTYSKNIFYPVLFLKRHHERKPFSIIGFSISPFVVGRDHVTHRQCHSKSSSDG